MRGKRAVKRILTPDPIYKSRLVTRFVNKIMWDGKKSVAFSVFYKAMDRIEQNGKNPLSTFETALTNAAPKMEVRARRVGGASYQVPVEVRGDRKEALAIRWLLEAARKRSNKEYRTFDNKLATELIEAAEGKGAAIKKKDDTLRMAEANKAFSHFKW